MSFLNPVSEPVLRFKSTDAGAPQINYNARVAGDVKAVLKACLVTGYGTTASAGWSIVNEVNNVAEFVSPSAAMSDYRLGIDDTSASSTTWYYQYQDARTNPSKNTPKKSLLNISASSPSNGWQMLVTEQGLFFVEIVKHADIPSSVARLTYWGRVKSALSNAEAKNTAFWCIGHGAPYDRAYDFLTRSVTDRHVLLGNISNPSFSAINIDTVSNRSKVYGESVIDSVSEIFLQTSNSIIGKHPGMLIKDNASDNALYGVYDTDCAGRPGLYVALGAEVNITYIKSVVRSVLVYLDFWEY